MRARSTEGPHPRRAAAPGRVPAHGFTMVELVAVLLLVGVLAAVAVPRLNGLVALRSAGWRDQVVAALRQAALTAQGHRRLVCASIASNAVTLSIASGNPATSCNTALPGHDGDSRWAWDSGAPATSASPATLYFQPSGRVTSDGAGASAVSATISISGEAAITLAGETGHVD